MTLNVEKTVVTEELVRDERKQMAHHWLTFKKEMTSILVLPWPQLGCGWLLCCLAIMTKCLSHIFERGWETIVGWSSSSWLRRKLVKNYDCTVRGFEGGKIKDGCWTSSTSQWQPVGGANMQIYTLGQSIEQWHLHFLWNIFCFSCFFLSKLLVRTTDE